jgi:hypothetical protein
MAISQNPIGPFHLSPQQALTLEELYPHAPL